VINEHTILAHSHAQVPCIGNAQSIAVKQARRAANIKLNSIFIHH
jgi:hypothetical protein